MHDGIKKLKDLEKKQKTAEFLQSTGRDISAKDLHDIPPEVLNELSEVVGGLDIAVDKIRKIFQDLLEEGYVDITLIATAVILREILDEVKDDEEDMYEAVFELITSVLGEE